MYIIITNYSTQVNNLQTIIIYKCIYEINLFINIEILSP